MGDFSGPFGNDQLFEVAFLFFNFDLNLNVVGNWRYQVSINDGIVVDAPFKVVATSRQVVNRAPNRVAAHLLPADYFGQLALECSGAQENDAVRDLVESFGAPPGLRRIEERVDEINERLIQLASKLARDRHNHLIGPASSKTWDALLDATELAPLGRRPARKGWSASRRPRP